MAEVPNEAVEAGAQAMLNAPGDPMDAEDRARMLTRLALEAAAPFLVAQEREAGVRDSAWALLHAVERSVDTGALGPYVKDLREALAATPPEEGERA